MTETQPVIDAGKVGRLEALYAAATPGEVTGANLYERFWKRNNWANATPFASQAPAIINMWNGIADDARAALKGSQ